MPSTAISNSGIAVGETTKIASTSGTGTGTVGGTVTIVTPSSNPGVGNAPNGVIGNFDRVYTPATAATVTAGTAFTISLSSGADQYGNTLGMLHVGRIHVYHQGSTGSIMVGGGTHPVMGSDQMVLHPGGSCVFSNHGVGYAVTSGAVGGVSPVEALPFVDSTGSGTFNISYMGLTTAAITYSATVATLKTNINAALDSTFGAGNLVASGASLATVVITGTLAGYQYQAFGGHFVATLIAASTGYTIGGSSTKGTSTTTTAGVAAISGQQDTLTIAADGGVVPFSVIAAGRSL